MAIRTKDDLKRAVKGMLRKDAEDGKEQGYDEAELDRDQELAHARVAKGGPLDGMTDAQVAKYVRRRWDRLEPHARKIQAQLRVNWHRYKGRTFAQVHPTDPSRVYMPYGAQQKLPPTINKIERAVDRYVAQTTADEPIIEGVPESHSDEARDAAEAVTSALRGEWDRLNLHRQLQRVTHFAAVLRSGFWDFEWDSMGGGRVKAQKFFIDIDGKRRLDFVDRQGNRVPEEQAAEIWQGNTTVSVRTPFNVRWTGGAVAHEADEVLVGQVITLQQLYDMDEKYKDVKLSELLAGVPQGAEEWLSDLTGESGLLAYRAESTDDDVDVDGHHLDAADSKLDAPVFLLRYYRPVSRSFPRGFSAMVAGKYLCHSGPLRYGVIPIVQFKLLDDLKDPLGRALVDILKDPQELLDFVNGNILRFLAAMKRRWFVPLSSGVKARDLMNPTRSIIHFNPNGGAPIAEETPEMPATLPQMAERFDREFDDQLTIHDTMQGKHVPGVTSGRHAEALRSGDETVLGLTRLQLQEALEYGGRVLLEIIKKEWTVERRVAYFEGREYLEHGFSSTDFGGTKQVRLKKGTLLMLTQAQKLETLFGYAEMGALNGQELRKLAPLADTAGVSITEDPHYQHAHRENYYFLRGPSPELLAAREKFDAEMASLEKQTQDVQSYLTLGGAANPDLMKDVEVASQKIQMEVDAVMGEWNAQLALHIPLLTEWERMSPSTAQVHIIEHMAALAHDKVGRFPEWWVKPFEQHLLDTMAVMAAAAPPAEGAPAPEPAQ